MLPSLSFLCCSAGKGKQDPISSLTLAIPAFLQWSPQAGHVLHHPRVGVTVLALLCHTPRCLGSRVKKWVKQGCHLQIIRNHLPATLQPGGHLPDWRSSLNRDVCSLDLYKTRLLEVCGEWTVSSLKLKPCTGSFCFSHHKSLCSVNNRSNKFASNLGIYMYFTK